KKNKPDCFSLSFAKAIDATPFFCRTCDFRSSRRRIQVSETYMPPASSTAETLLTIGERRETELKICDSDSEFIEGSSKFLLQV
ncbi:unnamed protein product, partial [Arabidopsis halleri]